MHRVSHNYTGLHRASQTSHDSFSEIDEFLICFRLFCSLKRYKILKKIAMNQTGDKKAEKVLKKRIKNGKVSINNILLDLSLISSA